MQNKKRSAMPLKLVAALAMLAALSMILGKYLQIPMGNVMRFSFENLPILFAGICFGPICGALVGAVADLVGCLMVGYEINIVVTAGAVLCGAISGTVSLLLRCADRLSVQLRICLSVIAAHAVASVMVKTLGLAVYYDMPIGVLMLWRLLNYVIVGALECVLLCVLLKNKAIMRTVGSIGGTKAKE